MNTASRFAWTVIVCAASAANDAIAQTRVAPPPAEHFDELLQSMPHMHEGDLLNLQRKRDREHCMSLVLDIENVERMNSLLRQKAQLLETGATPTPAPPAGEDSTGTCASPSADLLVKLTTQDNADWQLHTLLTQKIAVLEKQRKDAGTAGK